MVIRNRLAHPAPSWVVHATKECLVFDPVSLLFRIAINGIAAFFLAIVLHFVLSIVAEIALFPIYIILPHPIDTGIAWMVHFLVGFWFLYTINFLFLMFGGERVERIKVRVRSYFDLNKEAS